MDKWIPGALAEVTCDRQGSFWALIGEGKQPGTVTVGRSPVMWRPNDLDDPETFRGQTLKPLLPAAASMAEAWEALKAMPDLTANHAFYSVYLETGRLIFCMPSVTVEYQTYVVNTCMAKITDKTYDAHMRDMQKFGVLRDWLNAVRTREQA